MVGGISYTAANTQTRKRAAGRVEGQGNREERMVCGKERERRGDPGNHRYVSCSRRVGGLKGRQ